MFAPIIIFAFNRPNALMNTVQSLLQNEEAKDSDLYVYVDMDPVMTNQEKKNK